MNAQEMQLATATAPAELARERGAVLRGVAPEDVLLDANDYDIELGDDESVIINMGPQHPSTHGVLRVMMELKG